jgi:cytochrome c
MTMKLRAVSAGCVLAIALAACSGEAPTQEASDADSAAVTPLEAAPLETGEAAAAPAADTAPAAVVEPAKDAEVAAKTAPVTPVTAAVATTPAPVAEVVKVAEVSHPASYNRCITCHTVNKGSEDKLGPNLFGVFRSAAGQGSYAYSSALKESGLTWDEATLHKWLENPRALVPGNRMSFPGIKDAAKRQEIIDYLKQQS